MTYLRVFTCVLALTLAACGGDGVGNTDLPDSGLALPTAGNGGGAGVTAGSGVAGNGAAGVTSTGTAGTLAGTGSDPLDGGTDATTEVVPDAGEPDAAHDAGEDAEVVDASMDMDAATDAGGDTDAAVGGGSWPPPPATQELMDLPGHYSTAICTALEDCLQPTYFEFAYDGTECPDRVITQLEDREFVYLQASIDAERVVLDATKLEGCYAAVAALGCDVLTSRAPAACNEAVQGVVPTGDPCVIDNDCVAGHFCDRSGGCPGQCVTVRDADGACNRDEQCAGGLLCTGGSCRAPAITGEDCDAAGAPPCALGNLCVGADAEMDVAGMCVDQETAFSLDADEECDPSAGQWCKDGLACVVDQQPGGGATDLWAVCQARVAEDAACHFSFAPEQCPPHQYCPADLNPEYVDECVDRPGEGQACGLYGVCAQGLRCKSDKCTPLGRIGDDCGTNTDCASQRCKSGECAAPQRCRLDAVGPVCGDDSCDEGDEDCENCPEDCGACPAVCPNTKCEAGEDCDTCAADCGACPAECGDDTCDPTEDCLTCAADCGACPAPYSACAEDADCGAGKKCVEKSVASLPLLPPTLYGYCAENCSTATTCSGASGQRTCTTGGSCALQCDPVLGVLDPNRRCPQLGMQCISNVCTWVQ
jgi:Dickkopf N-terminal cysteine-rich region